MSNATDWLENMIDDARIMPLDKWLDKHGKLIEEDVKMQGYKLFRRRKDGSIGPLFINKRQRINIGVEYPYEECLTKGFKFRPGWHICRQPFAPHLSKRDRVWAEVDFTLMDVMDRPASQGGVWYLGSTLKVKKLIEK